MITKDQIPDYGICHICGQQMKVFELSTLAEQLGMRIPEGYDYVIRCCEYELTQEDENEALQLRDLLVEYHRGTERLQ